MIGIVYKLENKKYGITYVGATIKSLLERKYNHKACWKLGRDLSLYPFFDLLGFDSFEIEELGRYDVCDRKHLSSKEQLWINKLQCINRNDSFGLLFQEKKQLAYKRWYSTNFENLKKKWRERYLKSKETQGEFICECGSRVKGRSRYMHERTLKHKTWEVMSA